MPLNETDRNNLEDLLQKAGLPGLKHINLHYNLWTIATWNQDETPWENPKVYELENMWKEIASTDRNTTIMPLQYSAISPTIQPMDFTKDIPNILTKPGMTHMAKKNTNEEPTDWTQYCAVGDQVSPADATLDDTALESEQDRKAWTDAVVLNETEKYAVSFVRADFASDVTLTEAGGFIAAAADTMIFRVTYAGKTVGTGQEITLQASVQHLNGTAI